MQKSSESEKSSETIRAQKSSELQKSRDTQKSSETPKSTETQKSPNKHGRGRQIKKTAEGKGDGRVKVNKESVKSAERCQSVSSGSQKDDPPLHDQYTDVPDPTRASTLV